MKPFLLYFLFVISRTTADINKDKQSLLAFAASVPHGRKLNWRPSFPICSSWVGITCAPNGTRVIALHLPGIGIHGPIPANTISNLNALTVLSLRSNRLNGSLPRDILSLRSLRYVYLQHNNLSGDIPQSLSSQLTVLDLSFNSFTGSIPMSIRSLGRLTKLSLQNNSLTGAVPDLNVKSLDHLNLSYNHLHGLVPTSLRKFPTSSFSGNSITPAPSPTVPHGEKSNKKLSLGAVVAIPIGCSGVLFLFVLMIALCCLKKEGGENDAANQGKASIRRENPKEDFGSGVQEAEKNKLVFFEGCSFTFDLEDLLRASAEVMGKGSYGTTYKATLEDGTTVAVKRLKEVVVGKREFEQQMEIVDGLCQHPNIVPLRAYYYSKDEKLLVYDHVLVGSLSSLLHGCGGNGIAIDWDSRVTISLGTARGIAHIHSASGGKFVHGNVKSSNVLLAQDLNGRISDFGLAPMMGFPASPSKVAGYRAPEVVETRKCTQKSDVYSFGVILLEMLTGKVPVQSPGDEDDEVDLPRWVQSVVREEWTAEVFDVELMKYQNIEEEMLHMLQIAMSCVSKMPDERPDMDRVVRMIEEIRPSDTRNMSSSSEDIA